MIRDDLIDLAAVAGRLRPRLVANPADYLRSGVRELKASRRAFQMSGDDTEWVCIRRSGIAEQFEKLQIQAHCAILDCARWLAEDLDKRLENGDAAPSDGKTDRLLKGDPLVTV